MKRYTLRISSSTEVQMGKNYEIMKVLSSYNLPITYMFTTVYSILSE